MSTFTNRLIHFIDYAAERRVNRLIISTYVQKAPFYCESFAALGRPLCFECVLNFLIQDDVRSANKGLTLSVMKSLVNY